MTEKVNAIVLGTVKHSDRHNITTLYTRECGRMAVATPAGSGRTACARRALMMPLSAVEATVGSGAGRDIGTRMPPQPLLRSCEDVCRPVCG